jgi:uncharacterized membrane protein YcjF (UPF0283 family)
MTAGTADVTDEKVMENVSRAAAAVLKAIRGRGVGVGK